MTASCDTSPRILIADDQPDLLDALKLLLKGQGIEIRCGRRRRTPRVRALESRPFDLVLMDLNYTGDTTSGREGIDLLARVQQHDRLLPVVVDDRLGQRRSGGRGHAPRRARLRAEAVGQRAPARDAARRKSRRAARAARRRRRAARARRSAAHPDAPAARSRSRKSTAGSSRSRGSRPPASAATASTRSASATRASRSRSPTSSARAFRRRC